ncbi:hypothetical protein KDK_48860 [Dictyobacter kobayashii]|uniref:Uncharacterized protein n=2 Tax=Dictyobacter kobayashii TaxID=2014872 RepID=A0A402APP0_9CHLR|nr:hypothetical protein KDK_48860 [Dictyobacter kobayashii]
MFGWLREGRPDEALQAAGWAGAMSLPRILSLQPDDTLKIEPAAELTQLRRRHLTVAPQAVTGQRTVINQLSTNALEIILEIESNAATSCGLEIQDSAYPQEGIRINLQATELSIEQRGEECATA